MKDVKNLVLKHSATLYSPSVLIAKPIKKQMFKEQNLDPLKLGKDELHQWHAGRTSWRKSSSRSWNKTPKHTWL